MRFHIAIVASVFMMAFTFVDDPQWQISPGESTVSVEGTSTVHDWTCTATDFEGAVLGTQEQESSQAIPSLAGVTFSVPSDALDCDNGTMNRKTRGALKAEDHPRIVFEMEDAETKSATDNGVTEMVVAGQLAMAGDRRSVQMTVTAFPMEGGDFNVRGELSVNMTDWDIRPPKAMLGVLKTGEEVTIRFNVFARSTKDT